MGLVSSKSDALYMCLSTDIVNNKIAGASNIGWRVYVLDTSAWYCIAPDLTLYTYAEPVNFTGSIGVGHVDGLGTAGNPTGGIITVQGVNGATSLPIILDAEYGLLQINGTKYGLVAENEFHYKVHEGLLWSASYFQTGLAQNGTVTIGITTGTKDVHIAFIHSASGDARIDYYDKTVSFTGGTPITIINHDLAVATPPSCSMVSSPTIVGAGSIIRTIYIPGGTGGNRGGGLTSPMEAEYIIPASMQSYLTFTNLDGASGIYNMLVDFYEV